MSWTAVRVPASPRIVDEESEERHVRAACNGWQVQSIASTTRLVIAGSAFARHDLRITPPGTHRRAGRPGDRGYSGHARPSLVRDAVLHNVPRAGDASLRQTRPWATSSGDLRSEWTRPSSASASPRCSGSWFPGFPGSSGGQEWPEGGAGPSNGTATRLRRFPASSGGEALNEPERRVSDLAPAAVDGQGVAAVRDLDELGHSLVVLLPLVGGLGNGGGDRVVLLP
jgi:hypothetical protein